MPRSDRPGRARVSRGTRGLFCVQCLSTAENKLLFTLASKVLTGVRTEERRSPLGLSSGTKGGKGARCNIKRPDLEMPFTITASFRRPREDAEAVAHARRNLGRWMT